MKNIILFFLISTSASAYTLNNNFEARFKSNDVNVYIDDSTTCYGVDMTIEELQSFIAKAVDRFWNRVPTSALHLNPAGFTAGINNINDGRLCAPTDDSCMSGASPGTLIPPVNDIVIACNNLNANFGSGNVLAVTVPNHFSGSKIVGAVILINENSSAFKALSSHDKISVIAHEIGHAIGLGHPTDHPEALMYYRTVNLRRALSQDDMDGVSYLYPVKMDGFGLLGGICGTIDFDDKTPPSGTPFVQMVLTLGVMLLLSRLIRLLIKRSNTSPAL